MVGRGDLRGKKYPEMSSPHPGGRILPPPPSQKKREARNPFIVIGRGPVFLSPHPPPQKKLAHLTPAQKPHTFSIGGIRFLSEKKQAEWISTIAFFPIIELQLMFLALPLRVLCKIYFLDFYLLGSPPLGGFGMSVFFVCGWDRGSPVFFG